MRFLINNSHNTMEKRSRKNKLWTKDKWTLSLLKTLKDTCWAGIVTAKTFLRQKNESREMIWLLPLQQLAGVEEKSLSGEILTISLFSWLSRKNN